MSAMPLMIGVLCVMAIAYRYYSAFLAAKVAALDDARETPAQRLNDGQNYHPTNKWVLFGHHFAAISGAGPLIGPVLAAQFGYLPGLLWIVIGVVFAGPPTTSSSWPGRCAAGAGRWPTWRAARSRPWPGPPPWWPSSSSWSSPSPGSASR